MQAIEFAARLGAKIAAEGRIQQNSLFFSLLAGKFAVETGSIWAASTTTQSRVCGNFPAAGEKPPGGGMRRERLVSVTCDLELEGSLGALFSGLEFPFPGNGDCGRQRPVRL